MRRLLLALAFVCASGCASVSPFLPPLQVHTEPLAHLGVNINPAYITTLPLEPLVALGQPLVLRVPVQSYGQAYAVLAAVRAYPSLSVLLLVERPDLSLVSDLAPLGRLSGTELAGIELCNECNLQDGVTLYKFAEFTDTAIGVLQRAGWSKDIITGGLWLDDDVRSSMRYAALMLDNLASCDILFGVHPYGSVSDDVLQELQSAAGCHRLAATEFGMPSRTPAEDAAQLAYLQEQFAGLRRGGAVYALIYRWESGASATDLDNFGLTRLDRSVKPGADVLR